MPMFSYLPISSGMLQTGSTLVTCVLARYGFLRQNRINT